MTYQPYLIANYSTGIDKSLQPWLTPDDAQQELFDGDVYRGTMSKRDGYKYYATGEEGGYPYTESRIVNFISNEEAKDSGVPVVGNGTAGPYTFRLTNDQVKRGSVTVTAGAQNAIDDGLGGFITTPAGGNGTISYGGGNITITFLNNVPAATPITIAYSYAPGWPVLMIATFITGTNIKSSIVADGRRLNIYNFTTNTYDYLGLTASITGITNANPAVVTTAADHNLSTGDKVFIYGVRGMNNVNNQTYDITVLSPTTFSLGVSSLLYPAATINTGIVQLVYQGSIAAPATSFYSWVNYADKNGNPRLLFTNNVGQIGYYAPHLANSVGNYVSYPIVAAPDFQMVTDAGVTIATITCLLLFEVKDRLIMLRTTENGIIRPQRIRISGTGVNSDNFLTSATGAGFIDIPDGTWIQGAAFNRDDLIIYTESSTWTLKYTGNDTTPFTLDKIDPSRGSDAPFSAFTYLNKSSVASKRGLTITDGYQVARKDMLIPDFAYDEIDQDQFHLCFSGVVDDDRDHYMIYPPSDQVEGAEESKRILVTNYDEESYSIYRIPLSCMGTHVSGFDVTWADLLKYKNWNEFGNAYGNWNSFSYSKGAPFSLGGGHHGEIWQLAKTESEDNPVKIRNITIPSPGVLEVTTDWNNYVDATGFEAAADAIFLTGILGMVQANNKQFSITSIISNNVFRLQTDTTGFSTYTGGGEAVRVIPFSSLFKKFNPYVNTANKVRCGWIYLYVDSTDVNLTRNINIQYISKTILEVPPDIAFQPCYVTTFINHGLTTGDQVLFQAVAGMTEINGLQAFVTVTTPNTFSIDIDTSTFSTYTSGGFFEVPDFAKLNIEIITNDTVHKTRINNPSPEPYQVNATNMVLEDGSKKWYKAYINQTGKFIQFRLTNTQAGAKINIQATMIGMMPSGRLM
jgi:hypothetical protein